MIWFLCCLLASYVLLIILLTVGFLKIDLFKGTNTKANTHFSVIIPFRNEAEKLPELLKSIRDLAYPKELVEFILVNDASSDTSVNVIEHFLETFSIATDNIQLINNKRFSNSPKKDAISAAVSISKNEWIVTTDADCILPKKWLSTLSEFITKYAPKMVVAPVNYKAKDTFLAQFQLLDFMSLQGTTIGGFGINFPFLCNGANLAYRKEEFLKLKGFEGNNNIASGDDIFLFEKFIQADKKSVLFLKSKDAIVSTFPVKTVAGLVQQRVRWASKTSKLKANHVQLIGLLVFLVNLSILAAPFYFSNILLILFGIKIAIDLVLFMPVIKFYNHKKTFYKWYVPSSILYPFFSVFVVLKSLFSAYRWKGRTFKK